MAKDPVKYWRALDVKGVADELIKQFHLHLLDESILFVFRSEHTETNGRINIGAARKLTGTSAYLAKREYLDDVNSGTDVASMDAPGYVLMIEIAHDVWTRVNAAQRVAIVDHLLCHFGIADGAIGMRAPDVVEFREVIDRNGLWRPEVEELAATLAQFKLFPAGGPVDAQGVLNHMIDEAGNPDSKIAKALRPKKGSSITSVTIESGGKSVTLEAE